jgi:ABC-type nitrate/sulfonate/bicarbonate transport system substrate-binding protein
VRRSLLLQALGGIAVAAPFAGTAFADDLQTVRIGLSEGDDATPTLYAIKVGLFKKYGIDAQVTPVPSGAAGLAAVAGGSISPARACCRFFPRARRAFR